MKHNILFKIKALLLALLCISSAYYSAAQNTRYLPLNEAIELSLQNSKQLKLSKAKVDEATANYKDFRNNYFPDVKAQGAYMRLNNPNIDLKVKLGGGSSSGGSEQQSSAPPKVDQAEYGIVNASLPIFSGMRMHYGIQSAKYLEQAAKLDAENDRESVIQNTISAYSNLYKAKRTVDLVTENLAQQQQRVTDFSNLEQNGLLARNDLLKAELQESNAELAKLDAENNFKITCINMNLMLGLPEDLEIIPDSASFQTLPDAGTAIQWEATAFQSRKDKEALFYREKAAVANIKSTKGEYWPGIALTGGYIALNVPNFLTVTNALDAGIGLQYNFAALWKTGAKVAAAKARLNETLANEGMLDDQIKIQINQAYEDYLVSLKKIDVYAKAVEQANENYNITKNKYDNSLVTTTDLLDADVAQFQAKLNYIFSKADASVAYKKLTQTAGVLNFNSK